LLATVKKSEMSLIRDKGKYEGLLSPFFDFVGLSNALRGSLPLSFGLPY